MQKDFIESQYDIATHICDTCKFITDEEKCECERTRCKRCNLYNEDCQNCKKKGKFQDVRSKKLMEVQWRCPNCKKKLNYGEFQTHNKICLQNYTQLCSVCQTNNRSNYFGGWNLCSFTCLLILKITEVKNKLLQNKFQYDNNDLDKLRKEIIKESKIFEQDPKYCFLPYENYDNDYFESDVKNQLKSSIIHIGEELDYVQVEPVAFGSDIYGERNLVSLSFNQKAYDGNCIKIEPDCRVICHQGVQWDTNKGWYINIYSEKELTNGFFYFQAQFLKFYKDLVNSDLIIGISLDKTVQGKPFTDCATGWGLIRGRLRHNQVGYRKNDIYDTEMKPETLQYMGVFVNTFTGTIAFTKNNELSEIAMFRNVKELRNTPFYPTVSMVGDSVIQFQVTERIPEFLQHLIDEGRVQK